MSLEDSSSLSEVITKSIFIQFADNNRNEKKSNFNSVSKIWYGAECFKWSDKDFWDLSHDFNDSKCF